MKVLKIIIGIVLTFMGLTMMIFALLFYFNEYDEIILLASLYVALFISAIVITLGITAIPFRKEKKDEKEN